MDRKIDIDELKKIQLSMLEYVDEFCRRNNIDYWITSGTLLGAVRHKGYIPWDDDIDIGMKRVDYEKFMVLFNKVESPYIFKCYEIDNTYQYQMGKILDTRTVLYEPNAKSGYEISVYLDLFVYDYIPNDRKTVEHIYKKRDFYKKIRTLQSADRHNGSILRQRLLDIVSMVLKVIPKKYLVKKIVMNGEKYRKVDTGYFGDYVGDYRLVIDSRILDEFIDVEFEGKKFKAPLKFDEWLGLFYGNYMQLPPEEKRIPHHEFEAYYI